MVTYQGLASSVTTHLRAVERMAINQLQEKLRLQHLEAQQEQDGYAYGDVEAMRAAQANWPAAANLKFVIETMVRSRCFGLGEPVPLTDFDDVDDDVCHVCLLPVERVDEHGRNWCEACLTGGKLPPPLPALGAFRDPSRYPDPAYIVRRCVQSHRQMQQRVDRTEALLAAAANVPWSYDLPRDLPADVCDWAVHVYVCRAVKAKSRWLRLDPYDPPASLGPGPREPRRLNPAKLEEYLFAMADFSARPLADFAEAADQNLPAVPVERLPLFAGRCQVRNRAWDVDGTGYVQCTVCGPHENCRFDGPIVYETVSAVAS